MTKLLSLEPPAEEVRRMTGAGQTVGLCHGCFDLLDRGHLRHLEAARRMADTLVGTVTLDRFPLRRGAFLDHHVDTPPK